MVPLIQIVDEDDNPLGQSSIQEARDKGYWHRYIRLLIDDGNDNYLLQLRGPQNRIFPECWDYSAAGHVDAGENYEDAAKRELQEEIGLTDVPLKEIEYFKTQDKHGEQYLNRFNKTFEVTIPKKTELNINPDEVMEMKWFSVDEIQELAKNQPEKVTPALVRLLDRLIK